MFDAEDILNEFAEASQLGKGEYFDRKAYTVFRRENNSGVSITPQEHEQERKLAQLLTYQKIAIPYPTTIIASCECGGLWEIRHGSTRRIHIGRKHCGKKSPSNEQESVSRSPRKPLSEVRKGASSTPR